MHIDKILTELSSAKLIKIKVKKLINFNLT